MVEMIEANWLAFALALAIGLLVAWWLFGRASKGAAPRQHRPDVLDEGAAPSQRNQALIDAPSAAATATGLGAAGLGATGPDIMGGIGEIAAVAAQTEVAAAAVAPAPAPVPTGAADDLIRIKGVGPKLVALLNGMGVTAFAQIAAWSEADIDRVDARLGTFAGRIRRDSWVEQAKFLAAGDVAGFEAKFGKV